MARTVIHVHLTTADTITAREGAGDRPDHATIDIKDEYGSVIAHLFVSHEDLPQRIAELQAVVLALRNVVDDIIADEKATTPPPAYETLTVADLTVGRHIQRCGVDPVGRWLTVLGIAPHPHLPGAVLVDLDGDVCATLNERDAVRVKVGGEDEPEHPPVVDLMAALESSLAEAKAARDRQEATS